MTRRADDAGVASLRRCLTVLALVGLLAAGCSSSARPAARAPVATSSTTEKRSVASTTLASSASVCGNSGTAPKKYRSVVVFAFENRSWGSVGGVGFGSDMPYLHDLAQQCSYFTDWT